MDTLLLKQSTREKLQNFWNKVYLQAENDTLSTKGYNLPLARIKRLMKVEENVKMIGCEVPIIFSKVTEKFIEELTMRAWVSTESSKRKILHKCDIHAGVKTSEMFDFLIYVVPRNEHELVDSKDTSSNASSNPKQKGK